MMSDRKEIVLPMAFCRHSALALFVLACAIAPAPATAQSPDSALFAVTFTTGPAWDQTKPAGEQRFMGDHSRNLFRLRDNGVIVTGGRFGEFGLVVVRAGSVEAARELFQTDLAVANGVFAMRIQPWLTIFDGCIPAVRPDGPEPMPVRPVAADAFTDRRSP
jgi:uncharacterized protein YciI